MVLIVSCFVAVLSVTAFVACLLLLASAAAD
jgi:hypothetical protein